MVSFMTKDNRGAQPNGKHYLWVNSAIVISDKYSVINFMTFRKSTLAPDQYYSSCLQAQNFKECSRLPKNMVRKDIFLRRF